MSAQKVEFELREFLCSHMREPRGRGSWAFRFPGSEEAWFTPSMTFSEAKKAAKAEALRRFPSAKHVVLDVLP